MQCTDKGSLGRVQYCSECRGVTGIFFWGGKVIFPDFFPGVKCFFPVENSHFGRPKTNFRRFQKWKAKKKKKKKRSSPLFLMFSCFHFQFSTFSSQFSPLFPFFLASFFPIRQQNFPVRSLWGALCPPCPPPPPPVTPLSEWTELGYGMARLFDSFVPRWLMKAQPLFCVAI